VRLSYEAYGRKIGLLEPLVGRSGWLRAWKLRTKSFDEEESILLAAIDSTGAPLSEDHCRKLLALPAETERQTADMRAEQLDQLRDQLLADRLKELEARNLKYLDEEQLKLDRWAEDLKLGLEQQIKDADKEIREAKRASSLAATLEQKLATQKEIKTLEAARNKKRRELFDMQDKIDARREDLIARIQSQMQQSHKLGPLFAFEWTLPN